MDKGIVIGIGELLFDVFPTGKQLGGAPVNFAYHIAQLGLDSLAISAIGKDKLGDEIVNIMNEKKIKALVPRIDVPTGTVQVSLDAAGVPNFTITRDVAWDKIPCDERILDAAKRARAVCFGSLAQRDEVSRKTINYLLDNIPEQNDAMVIFDINLRQSFYSKEIIESSLDKCNVLKINDDEYSVVSGMLGYDADDFQAGCNRLLERYSLKYVILTCGANGSYVFWRGGNSYLDTPKVRVVDTVGAGDSFSAAFCAAILKGESIEQAHGLAVKVSAFVCTKPGAMPELPCDILN